MTFTAADYDAITCCVEEAEESSAAEFVVVIRPHSGHYRDVDFFCGALTAWAGLLVILFSPWTFPLYTVPFEVALLFALAAWVCSVTPLRRWLTPRRRREQQVKTATAAAFVEEGVTHTRARTGVLIYLSLWERHVEVIADTGVLAAVPAAEWNAFLFDIKQVEQHAAPGSALREHLRALGDLLTRYLPATADNPDEIPNRPRVGG